MSLTTFKILKFPDPRLRNTSEVVDPHDPLVQSTIDQMFNLMKIERGIGLAAPQIGMPMRIFITNVPEQDPIDRVFINPTLTLSPRDIELGEERCLSLPGVSVIVPRFIKARIAAIDREGKEFEKASEGFLARVWQHEYDHLSGILIVDHLLK